MRLRGAISRTVHVDPGLAGEAAALSGAYRSGATAAADHAGHVHDARSAAAYAATRMPATFAATARAMGEAADRLPGFAPASLLDVGAGTGAAAWAAGAVWPELDDLTLVDRELAAVELGRRLAAATADSRLLRATWRIERAAGPTPLPSADLVSAAYLLGELKPRDAAAVVGRLWAATRGVLVLVEPGSRAGYERIIAARSALIEAGAHVAAPCPGDQPCPIWGMDWCHFLARLDRSPLHRRAKGAERSWEDEPFAYVAAARVPVAPAARVVLGRPRHRPGVVELRVCHDGRIEQRTFSRRDGPAYRAARDLAWGDPMSGDGHESGEGESMAPSNVTDRS